MSPALPDSAEPLPTALGFHTSRRRTAEHEAAHAVIAALSGRVVHGITIAPSQALRLQGVQGIAFTGDPEGSWPVPLSATAVIDTDAAGLAWELLTRSRRSHRSGQGIWRTLQDSWRAAIDDRGENQLLAFVTAVIRVRQTLRRPEVARCVDLIADALEASPSGEVLESTVEQIIRRKVPSFDRQHAGLTWTEPTASPAPPGPAMSTLATSELRADLGADLGGAR